MAILRAWLAATKIAAPARRQDTLSRPRLVEVLRRGLEQTPLILISAPAGSGKTTLLADLPHSFPETVWAWLTLDSEDNDPSRFAAALMATLANSGVVIEEECSTPREARLSITAITN